MLNLQVIIASTREARRGPVVAEWLVKQACAHGKFHVELVDLADVNLPLFDEPRHPRLRQYEHEHTRAWSATVARADAFVFVTPEYDYFAPASLLNALQYLSVEWAYKPVGFASYGGVSGGMRGVQVTKQLVTTLKMMPLPEAVAIPLFKQYINEETGIFAPTEAHTKSATVMLDELFKWARALESLRSRESATDSF